PKYCHRKSTGGRFKFNPLRRTIRAFEYQGRAAVPDEKRFRIRKLREGTRNNIGDLVWLCELFRLKRHEDRLLHTAHVSRESGAQQRSDFISAPLFNESRVSLPFLRRAIAKQREGCGCKPQPYSEYQGRHRHVGTQERFA